MKRVANLIPVAVDRQAVAAQRTEQEMCYPALILSAELPWPVDAAHAHYDRLQTEDARIVPHVLIGCPFRTAVRTVEVQRRSFRDTVGKRRAGWLITLARAHDLSVVDQPP